MRLTEAQQMEVEYNRGRADERERKDKEGEMTCPFCGDDGFDRIGLKNHFYCYCKVYQDTEVL